MKCVNPFSITYVSKEPQMKASISKASIKSGLSVFVVIILLFFSHAGAFILFAIYVAPGLVYGLALISTVDNRASAVGSIFFIPLSLIINIASVYLVYKDLLDHGGYAPLRLISNSQHDQCSTTYFFIRPYGSQTIFCFS